MKVHDFPDPDLGDRAKAVPYGVYDLAGNEGWVSVGDLADTSESAVNSVGTWWDQLGRHRYPDATRLLVTADAGGSNGHRRPSRWRRRAAPRRRPDRAIDARGGRSMGSRGVWSKAQRQISVGRRGITSLVRCSMSPTGSN